MSAKRNGMAFDSEVKTFAKQYRFSEREAEIFRQLLLQTKTAADVAQRLQISPNTIRNHFQSIFHKTKTNSKTELLSLFINAVFFGFESEQEQILVTQKNRVTVLLVTNSAADFDLLQRAHTKSNATFNLVHVTALDVLAGDVGVVELKVPDLIVIDETEWKQGTEKWRKMRGSSRWATTPALVMTSQHNDEAVRNCYELGINSVVRKPQSFKAAVELVGALDRYWTDHVVTTKTQAS